MTMVRPRMNTMTKLALARAVYLPLSYARRVIGRSDTVRVRRSGCTWVLDLGEGIEFTVYLLGAFERETMRAYRRLLRPGDTVLDIGAHVGSHTLPMARCVGAQGRVVAVEPTATAYAKLTRNLAANPDLRQVVCPVRTELIGPPDDGHTPTTPGSVASGIYSSWPLRPTAGAHPIHCGRRESTDGATRETVDTLLRRLVVPRVHLVKMDIDGVECAVLAGASDLLRVHRPRFIMELLPYGLAEHGGSLTELIGIFRSHQYSFTDLRGALLPCDAGMLEATIPIGGSRNVIAIPDRL